MSNMKNQWAKRWNRFSARFRAPRVSAQRLSSDVQAFEARFEARLERARGKDWAKAVRRHLDAARLAAEERRISSGYESLLAAERDALPGQTPAERRARLSSLREEATRKLAGTWRGRAAKSLLGDSPAAVSIAAMQEAMFHVHSRSQNTYHKLDLLRQQLRLLAAILGILVLGCILLARLGAFDKINANASELLPIAVFFGLLGGALSAMISVKQTPMKLKIPDSQRSAVIALVRVLIGGAAAIPIYVLIEGNLITLSLGDGGTNMVPELLAFCFLGGFSERWFLGRIGALAGHKNASDEEVDQPAAAIAGEEGEPVTGAAAPLSFRAGVGAVVSREDGRVLVGQRTDSEGNTWQFPQGGIELDEPPLEAVQRELHEELGLEASALELVAETPTLISYRLPESYRNGRIGQGQTQAWFLFRMKGDGAAEVTPASEFRKVQWVTLADAVGLTDDFRREAYRQVSQAFSEPLQVVAAKPQKSAGRKTRARTRKPAADSTPSE